MSRGQEPILEGPMVALLVRLLQALLAHGQLAHARTPQPAWATVLPQRAASPFDVLLVSLQYWPSAHNQLIHRKLCRF